MPKSKKIEKIKITNNNLFDKIEMFWFPEKRELYLYQKGTIAFSKGKKLNLKKIIIAHLNKQEK